MRRQRLRLLVPHAQIAGERVAQGDQRAIAFDQVVDADAVGIDLAGAGHAFSPVREGQSSLRNSSATAPTIWSMCWRSAMSGGENVRTSPLVRTSTPLSKQRR